MIIFCFFQHLASDNEIDGKRDQVKKEMHDHDRDLFDDSYDESDNYSGPGLNEPKQSPMRRKEKFRAKGFQTEKKHKDRKRNYRNKMNDDLIF